LNGEWVLDQNLLAVWLKYFKKGKRFMDGQFWGLNCKTFYGRN
jgi:hypothetical protein